MKIGINCLSIKSKYVGGVTTYALGLIEGLVNLDSRHVFKIYVSPENYKLFECFKSEKIEVICCMQFTSLRFHISRLSALVGSTKLYKIVHEILYGATIRELESNNDVLYSPVPVSIPIIENTPTVLSIHDIQHVHFPEYFDYFTLRYKLTSYKACVENSTYIQASSLHMKDDFIENFSTLRGNSIMLVPEGVDIDAFSKKLDGDMSKKYKIPEEFLFFPAQLWHHKNHITVLKALNILNEKRDKKIHLVLTGGEFTASEKIFNYISENNMEYVHYLGKVPFDDLVSLYQQSKFLITAVMYESSSLPVLEAAASGVPIIASNTRPNLELSENLNINLFETLDYNDLCKVILNIWPDSDLQEKQVLYNKESIKQYSWGCIANKYISEIENRIS